MKLSTTARRRSADSTCTNRQGWLSPTDGAWLATPPPIVPRSTVGAGDSSLAGYVRADVEGAAAPARLQMAVAYGSGAAALPGTALPSPDEINLDGVAITAVPTPTRR